MKAFQETATQSTLVLVNPQPCGLCAGVKSPTLTIGWDKGQMRVTLLAYPFGLTSVVDDESDARRTAKFFLPDGWMFEVPGQVSRALRLLRSKRSKNIDMVCSLDIAPLRNMCR